LTQFDAKLQIEWIREHFEEQEDAQPILMSAVYNFYCLCWKNMKRGDPISKQMFGNFIRVAFPKLGKAYGKKE